MVSRGTVKAKVVWKMLTKCAAGHEREERDHNWFIHYNGFTSTLLSGGHGKRPGQFDVEIGHLKRLVKDMGIVNCARKHIPLLAQRMKAVEE